MCDHGSNLTFVSITFLIHKFFFFLNMAWGIKIQQTGTWHEVKCLTLSMHSIRTLLLNCLNFLIKRSAPTFWILKFDFRIFWQFTDAKRNTHMFLFAFNPSLLVCSLKDTWMPPSQYFLKIFWLHQHILLSPYDCCVGDTMKAWLRG